MMFHLGTTSTSIDITTCYTPHKAQGRVAGPMARFLLLQCLVFSLARANALSVLHTLTWPSYFQGPFLPTRRGLPFRGHATPPRPPAGFRASCTHHHRGFRKLTQILHVLDKPLVASIDARVPRLGELVWQAGQSARGWQSFAVRRGIACGWAQATERAVTFETRAKRAKLPLQR